MPVRREGGATSGPIGACARVDKIVDADHSVVRRCSFNPRGLTEHVGIVRAHLVAHAVQVICFGPGAPRVAMSGSLWRVAGDLATRENEAGSDASGALPETLSVSHAKFESAQVLQRCAAWVPPLADGAEDLITR